MKLFFFFFKCIFHTRLLVFHIINKTLPDLIALTPILLQSFFLKMTIKYYCSFYSNFEMLFLFSLYITDSLLTPRFKTPSHKASVSSSLIFKSGKFFSLKIWHFVIDVSFASIVFCTDANKFSISLSFLFCCNQYFK